MILALHSSMCLYDFWSQCKKTGVNQALHTGHKIAIHLKLFTVHKM